MSVSGSWILTIKSPTGPQITTLDLKDIDGALTGVQSGQGMSSAITDARFDGSNIYWINHVTKPLKMKLEFKGIVEGKKMSGKVKAGFMGSFPFTASIESTKAVTVPEIPAVATSQKTSFDEIDFFTDPSLIDDPYPYFDYLRNKSPVCRLPHRNVVAITGYQEALVILNDPKTFSSTVAVTGPIPDLPFVPEGDDITAQLEEYRDQIMAYGSIVTMDGAKHSKHRALLMRLFTPSRMKENEDYLWSLADSQIDELAAKGSCELISEYASPYAMFVIANLLGVPEEDRQTFRDQAFSVQMLDDAPVAPEQPVNVEFFSFLFNYFAEYITERRANPRKDILTDLALAKFPDGSTPEISDVVWVASFLFGAGQDTTARVLSAAMQVLAERPDLQNLLRDDRSRIPEFIEEVLRMDGPVKTASRLVLRTTTIGNMELKAGTILSLFYGGINRDPRKFEEPNEFKLGRPGVREHLAFGRGAHTCAGAALARGEVRASLDRILERLSDIRISDEIHGPIGQRRFEHEPTYLLRGVKKLGLEFKPVFT